MRIRIRRILIPVFYCLAIACLIEVPLGQTDLFGEAVILWDTLFRAILAVPVLYYFYQEDAVFRGEKRWDLRAFFLSFGAGAGLSALSFFLMRAAGVSAMEEAGKEGMLCFGPFPADGFMGAGSFTHFDGILAMYHDQGLAPFKALSMDEGVNFTAGLPVVRTSPAHGTAYDIAGKGVASEDSFRQAIYVAIDVFRNRLREKEARSNPLRKLYYEKRDDSDKLKLDSTEEEI